MKMKQKEKALDNLVEEGLIKSYSIRTLNEEGKSNPNGNGMRNTQELVLEFPSGKTLTIGTFCSGSAENTCFIFTGDTE